MEHAASSIIGFGFRQFRQNRKKRRGVNVINIKLTEMELIILLGLVAKTSPKDKSDFLKKSTTIEKQHKFSVEEIQNEVSLKLFDKLNKEYQLIIDKTTK